MALWTRNPKDAALHGPARPSGWLMWIALAAVSAICLIVGQMLYEARGELTNSAGTDARNIAAAVAQDVDRNFELLDLSLQALRDGVRDPRITALPADVRRVALFDRAVTATDVGTVFFLDPDGRIVIQSGEAPPPQRRFGDRDFFHVHVHDAGVGLFVSRPFLSPFDDAWSVAISRRVDGADGGFGGVVVAIIKLAYFETLFSRLELGRNGMMALMRVDATLLMRRPLDERDIGRVLDSKMLQANVEASRAGPVTLTSKLDGLSRLMQFHPIGKLPLVQVVGLSAREIYGPWWRKLAITVTTLAVLCGTILGLVGHLQVEVRRRASAEAAFAELAATDKLTGLPNRRRFDELLDTEWRRCGRNRQGLALLMIDVDNFKSYNDTYGHLGGDAVLAAIGSCLKQSLHRAGDSVARFGGEEFAVLLPDETGAGGSIVAERIRRTVAELKVPHVGSATGVVSVSIGVVCRQPQPTVQPDELVAAADLALYQAKAAGRNRCVLRTLDQAAA